MWLPLIPAFLVAVALLYLPGLLVSAGIRLRPQLRLAVAPAISLLVLSVSAIWASAVELRFSLLPVVVSTVIATAVTLLGARYLTRLVRGTLVGHWVDSPTRRRRRRRGNPFAVDGAGWPVVATVLAMVLMVRNIVRVIGSPTAIAQDFDSIFHLNVVRWILDTGDGSTFTVESMISGPNPPQPYPAAWHDLVALVAQLTGTQQLLIAQNAVILAVGAVVWSVGWVLVIRILVPRSPVALLAVAVLACFFPSLPYRPMSTGPLYPSLLAMTLLPTLLILVAMFFNRVPRGPESKLGTGAVLLLVIAGVGLTHPSALLSAMIVVLPMLFGWALDARLTTTPVESMRYRWITLGVTTVATVVCWVLVRPAPEATLAFPKLGMGTALIQGLLLRPDNPAVPWTLVVLTAAGAVSVFRHRRYRWLVVAHLGYLFCWVVAIALPIEWLRRLITGVWFNDYWRLAALLPITAIPLAVLGVRELVHWIRLGLRRYAPTPGTRRGRQLLGSGIAVGTALVLLALTLPMPWWNQNARQIAAPYKMKEQARLVDPDELALFDVAAQQVPADETIAVNPWTGASLVYAYTGRRVTRPHINGTDSPAAAVIRERLRDATTDPAVCPAVHHLRVGYVLDFGTRGVFGENHDYPGLEHLDRAEGFRLVERRGEAALYQVTACR
ncbi:DUF6541 family protein [Granulicoccus phenolivorans]|uniref:DUF6541 family protein n=1 Tax=Granulicoccus phenolivorans TaxID=266854 RepID=UPI000406B1F4|nr:DUF6541 family protein [Granulicoccus phenolivorans]